MRVPHRLGPRSSAVQHFPRWIEEFQKIPDRSPIISNCWTAAETGARAVAMTRVNKSSSATSTFNFKARVSALALRPQQNAVAVGVSGCDSLGEKLTALMPRRVGLRPQRTAPDRGGAEGSRHSEETASGESGHRFLSSPSTHRHWLSFFQISRLLKGKRHLQHSPVVVIPPHNLYPNRQPAL
jgi:hypothetical protein